MNPNIPSLNLAFNPTREGLYSVKLRVSYQNIRQRIAFPIKEGVVVKPALYERLVTRFDNPAKRIALSAEAQAVYDLLSPHIEKARLLAQQLRPFSIAGFKAAWQSEGPVLINKTDVISQMRAKAAEFEAADQIGNSDNYKSSARSFERFIDSLSPADRRGLLGDSPVLLLHHITPDFLYRYENWMLQFGKAPRSPKGTPTPAGLTTISMYTRNLRAIFNDAIQNKQIPADAYPFTKEGYTVPATINVKKSLTKQRILDIIAYPTLEGTTEQRSKCFWVFSYLCNGMNLSDIFRLRWKDVNLESEELTFVRQKTTRTSRAKQIKVVCKLFPQSLAILDEWGNKSRGPMDYLFPYLNDDMDARRKKAVIKQLVKQTNKYMARVAQALGIQEEVNTYAARHSFATILLRSEAPVAFISQSLGHTSLKTTEDYLGSFEDEQTRKYLSNLL
ncbi:MULTISPECIES: site-specific integrase [unclassified Spirosoma]|uniref:tyrosine-type recombinase/integrase n=1 Tax=unclassified Spirosoma TaxID=2621999 RepID=UPI00095BDC06|nr:MULTISPECIES: site-specific integrase [unclassified Spirosoma]MBN8821325.1 site-specific integrase [Spirosoma sp.]OJW78114.1 MAG: hypothetical protein BGO59_29280 [Spirosoma sp. 48-14]